ncbi:MAG: hypothetical protein RIE08_09800 [Acidimicrobiales bacterium]
MRHLEGNSGDNEAAEIRGVLEIEGACLYVALEEIGERYPVVWPSSTSWDGDSQRVILASGQTLEAGDSIYGGGGYHSVEDVHRLAGEAAADLAERCVDNQYGEIAIVNNQSDAIAPT